MGLKIKEIKAFHVISVLLKLCLCEKIKLFQTDGRTTTVTQSYEVRSLLECSVIFENSVDILSFSYNKETQICELSNNYVEGFTTTSSGWKVYTRIVNGGWSNWLSWSSCSVTCKDGTRTRSRTCSYPPASNGGQTCNGPEIESEICNERFYCFLGSHYFFGTEMVTQPEAVAICSAMSARLVIIESQEEIDFLETQVTDFHHWIGMTCTFGKNCTWVDGRNVDSGFTAWAPGEPKDTDCVWIGYYGKQWDDNFCYVTKKVICEFA